MIDLVKHGYKVPQFLKFYSPKLQGRKGGFSGPNIRAFNYRELQRNLFFILTSLYYIDFLLKNSLYG